MSLKILTVDDSKTIRMVIAKAFQPYDCVIVEGTNGVEGLAAASREKPDLIILDITMPLMDGVETLTKLKGDPSLKNIPVIMLTAESGRENVLKIAKLGVRDYIVKPFQDEALLEKAGRIVQLKARAQEKKAKTIDDAVSILVVEDKPAIVQQITDGLKNLPWQVTGKETIADATAAVNQAAPDIILVSLSLPNDEGFNLFQQLRSGAVSRGIPVFGMCIKTDSDRFARAEKLGFTAVVTKPLDLEVLKTRLIRALDLDVSSKYFSLDGDIQILALPDKVTDNVAATVERYLKPRLEAMVDSGKNKFILDLTHLVGVDAGFVKALVSILQRCKDLAIKVQVVAPPPVKDQMKTFRETFELPTVPGMDEARKALEAKAA